MKLLGQLLEEAYPNFVEKGLSYDLQSNVPAKTINADGNLLARLFDNLIGNAIKYGADGKRVLVPVSYTHLQKWSQKIICFRRLICGLKQEKKRAMHMNWK